ncbi:hypothetical protein [Amycolatopsis rifamycinica]|uniref:Uncharacterized protein n=1 Tax=Amycolatopsis rifamycinica TaxID=287986 RepID=A0A066UCB5_9PSEU|nr:hypothetical protein [Amycolatopsis rifamycinica]KDN21873.1 hypothetical protein DV20_13200 [Amycolatopsis rifamycinica]
MSDDEKRDTTPAWTEEEGSRASMAESGPGLAGEPDPQPGRAEVSERREPASPTGAVGQSDYPVTDVSGS